MPIHWNTDPKPKGMPAFICSLLKPISWLDGHKDIFIIKIKQDLPRQKTIMSGTVARVSEYSRIYVPWKMGFKHSKIQSCSNA